MLRCSGVREDLTAWIDGALPSRRHERVRQHVAACRACAAEAERVRAAIEWQRRLLARALAVPDVEVQPLQARLQQAVALEHRTERGDRSVSVWTRMWQPGMFRPLAVTGAVVSAVLAFVAFAGGPSALLIPLGIESPPAAVASQPELFKDYSLIQHLDALEHFDTVESMPLDDDQTTQNG
ncbi:MAG TPA: zf-HC2 domain-containing protein [Candidatus Acidoferrales bacterium]|nr:zf-HC2 domain-containing protein [Candidatus Acidoferrales bacterium]